VSPYELHPQGGVLGRPLNFSVARRTAQGMEPSKAAAVPELRVRAFVDYWNFQLSVNQWRPQFRLDWRQLGPWLAREAATLYLSAGQEGRWRYDGLHVYMSHDPRKRSDDGLRHWARNTLDRFPGVQLTLKERRPKGPPDCPVCHAKVETCPACNAGMARSVEKGVDTALVTDMIRLAWEDSYDLAVLVSADADFVPAVEYLDQRGRKVIHAGFPPKGMELSRKCWGNIDLSAKLGTLERGSPTQT
jgi:uncharacterized LabA/DUF88 family protein